MNPFPPNSWKTELYRNLQNYNLLDDESLITLLEVIYNDVDKIIDDTDRESYDQGFNDAKDQDPPEYEIFELEERNEELRKDNRKLSEKIELLEDESKLRESYIQLEEDHNVALENNRTLRDKAIYDTATIRALKDDIKELKVQLED